MMFPDARQWLSFKRGSPLRRMAGSVRMSTVEPLRRRAALLRRLLSGKTFIGVTGSSAKTTTTALLRHILDGGGVSWGVERGRNGIGDVRRALLGFPSAATHIVIEAGAGEPDAMRRISAILRPDLAIVTMVRMEHFSRFRTLDNVAEEKSWLAHFTRPGGVVVVNGDDDLAMKAAKRGKARLVTFGQGENADYRATAITAGYPDRMRLTIEAKGRRHAIETQFVPDYFWLPVTAAFAAAVELGVAPEDAARRIASCPTVFHRMNIIDIPGGPTFLLDTAKAPLHSIGLAFDTLAKARAPRKRIVLGHISDYAGNPRAKYRDAFAAARAVADEVLFINEHGHRASAGAEDVASGRFRDFHSSEKLVAHLHETALPGELILLKGSGVDHLERIALAFQEAARCWRDRCGVRVDCRSCGLLGEPFEKHDAIRRAERRARRWRWLTGNVS